jgi:hypothetical protein
VGIHDFADPTREVVDERTAFAEIDQMEKMSDIVVVNSAHEFANAKVAFRSCDRQFYLSVGAAPLAAIAT